MEALSPTMEEGRLVEWKKQEGETVAAGDVLAEVETDKAVMDLVARAPGTLLKQVITAGTTVPVSQLVGVIGKPGEDIAAIIGGNGQTGGRPAGEASPPAKRVEPKLAGDAPMPPAPPASAVTESSSRTIPAGLKAPPAAQPTATPSPLAGGRVKASPLARRIASERGLDLGSIHGSGPEGRIVTRDLEGASAERAAISTAGTAARVEIPAALTGFTDVPLTQIRKTIARRLAASIGPVPTFYLTTEVDMERVWEARAALNDAGSQSGSKSKVSFNDIIIKAVATALRQHPACNAWWQEDRIRYWNEIHVSMAVAVEDGLITPVIRNTDQKSLRQISAESHDLAARARDRRLRPEEYTGGTFSVSNLGMFDIDQFTAVINPPEAGILAVGSIVEKPVIVAGAVVSRRRMRVTMSCDHRVIDGATGAAFLKTLKMLLENPLAMVW
jgi:pyruvate dehydrogenase E2 component (dihydrolipoamide acetyltransferase)